MKSFSETTDWFLRSSSCIHYICMWSIVKLCLAMVAMLDFHSP